MTELYRVLQETTGSYQGRYTNTYWNKTVLYCGYSIDEARRVYHQAEPTDFGGSRGSPGSPKQMTTLEKLDTSDLPDTEPGDDWELIEG